MLWFLDLVKILCDIFRFHRKNELRVHWAHSTGVITILNFRVVARLISFFDALDRSINSSDSKLIVSVDNFISFVLFSVKIHFNNAQTK